MDTYIGEVKYENNINRITAIATPRQIERVPADAEFAFNVTYNVEDMDELMSDMKLLADGIKLLQMDYLGGHGSRGYGRVSFRDFAVEVFSLNAANAKEIEAKAGDIEGILKGSC